MFLNYLPLVSGLDQSQFIHLFILFPQSISLQSPLLYTGVLHTVDLVIKTNIWNREAYHPKYRELISQCTWQVREKSFEFVWIRSQAFVRRHQRVVVWLLFLCPSYHLSHIAPLNTVAAVLAMQLCSPTLAVKWQWCYRTREERSKTLAVVLVVCMTAGIFSTINLAWGWKYAICWSPVWLIPLVFGCVLKVGISKVWRLWLSVLFEFMRECMMCEWEYLRCHIKHVIYFTCTCT